MQDRELYARILGLEAPWKVLGVDLADAEEEVTVRVGLDKGSQPCPECGTACPRHDTRVRRWRHLDTCQFKTILEAEVPRVSCAEHGVKQIAVPWAAPGSRFTALLEAVVIDWLKESTISAVCRRLRLTWDEVAGIMQRAVQRGLARRPQLALRRIGVDETSFQKRHEYVTVVADLETSTVVHVADGRRKASLDAFYESLDIERLANLACVAMDMAKPYISSTKAHVPDAETKICFDRFHVSKIIGDAVDRVRRAEHKELMAVGDPSLTGTRYTLLRRGDDASDADAVVLGILQAMGLKSARAWRIKEAATRIWHYVKRGWAEKAWRRWISWAVRCRLDPMRKAAATIKEHLWGILNAVILNVTNATLESINAQIQRVKKAACGFRNRQRFRDAILFHLGGLDLYPAAATHPNS